MYATHLIIDPAAQPAGYRYNLTAHRAAVGFESPLPHLSAEEHAARDRADRLAAYHAGLPMRREAARRGYRARGRRRAAA